MRINARLLHVEFKEITENASGMGLVLVLQMVRASKEGAGENITITLAIPEWFPALMAKAMKIGMDRIVQVRADRLKQSESKRADFGKAATGDG